MEFLDTNLTKDKSLLLRTIHRVSTGVFLNKPDSNLILKIFLKILEK